MPIKINMNFFILRRSFLLRLATMVRSRDFAVSRKSCRSLPLSSESPVDAVAGVADTAAVNDRSYDKRKRACDARR